MDFFLIIIHKNPIGFFSFSLLIKNFISYNFCSAFMLLTAPLIKCVCPQIILSFFINCQIIVIFLYYPQFSFPLNFYFHPKKSAKSPFELKSRFVCFAQNAKELHFLFMLFLSHNVVVLVVRLVPAVIIENCNRTTKQCCKVFSKNQ